MTSESPSLLLDTNLLVLFVVGSVGHESIRSHKRTHAYVSEDFELLCRFMSGFRRTVVTPNILTEASNLISQTKEPLKNKVMLTLQALVSTLREEYVPSAEGVAIPEFLRLGLADCGTLCCAGSVSSVLTDDFDLYMELSRAGRDVTNFNHIRPEAWS